MRVLSPNQYDAIEKRLYKHGVVLIQETGCWLWQGDKIKSGYGRMWVNGKTRSIHRIAYELWVDEIPDGHLIRHKCDERSCINPTHLETGLAQDNYNDMVARGRRKTPKGDEHYETKIPSSKFKEVFDKYNKGGVTMKQLGEQYGVCAQTICNVLKRHRMAEA